MSWREDIQKRLEVFMGDGKSYFPLWKDAVMEVNYNVSQFNFPGVEGSLVRRRNLRNREFDIKFYFVSDENKDHLDTLKDFLESARDNRHWHIRHPYYGDIRCQPTSLKVDNSKHSLSIVTGKVIETILGVAPITLRNPTDALKVKLDNTNLVSNSKYVLNIPSPPPVVIQTALNNVNSLNKANKGIVTTKEEASELSQIVANAKSYIADFTNKSLEAMRELQRLAQFPIKTATTIFERVRFIAEEIRRTKDSLVILANTPVAVKIMFEKSMVDLYSALFMCVIPYSQNKTNTNDPANFLTSSDITDLAGEIRALWSDLVDTLDNLQSIEHGSGESYVQDSDVLLALEDMYNSSVSALYELASNSKKEIILRIEEDSNPIVLTHRFYGLDEEDENLNLFIKTNKLSLLEQLYIEKDREIKYYV